MAKPTTREEFKTYCLRKLGFPVIEINVDEDQVEDRVDEALEYWHKFHNEGTYLTYVSHQVTSNNVTDKYITLSDDLIGVKRILPITSAKLSSGMFDLRYQIRLNDLYNFSSAQATSYQITREHLQLLNMMFTGENPIRFNRHMDRLYIDMDWNTDIAVGEWIVIEGWSITDPETYTDVYGDSSLQNLATAMIKRQWGNNMKKYQGVQLIGGVEMNGQQIYEEATEEITNLKQEIRDQYELPPMFFIG
jgi:hypothetical protein